MFEKWLLLNSTFNTVGVKNETNFNVYDVWGAISDTGYRGFTICARRKADLDNQRRFRKEVNRQKQNILTDNMNQLIIVKCQDIDDPSLTVNNARTSMTRVKI